MSELETLRKHRMHELNAEHAGREELEARYGKVWSSDELRAEFEVLAFLAPFVEVRRRSDNAYGSVEFQHHPRFYFSFVKDSAQGDKDE